jgi:hypothetical protein
MPDKQYHAPSTPSQLLLLNKESLEVIRAEGIFLNTSASLRSRRARHKFSVCIRPRTRCAARGRRERWLHKSSDRARRRIVLVGPAVCSMKHTKVFRAYEGSRSRRCAVRRGISVGRRAPKGSVTGGTFVEGRACATEDQLLGLGVSNDDGIVVTAR